MSSMKAVILSTKLILEEGIFEAKEISQEEAQAWVNENHPENFCGHATVKLLGLEPETSRKQCTGYDQALCLAAKSRLEFGKEYSLEEIQEIGVEITLISKIKEFEWGYEGVISSSDPSVRIEDGILKAGPGGFGPYKD